MFQRLKGAFDSIAEEQARQRAVQRTHSNGSSSQASRDSALASSRSVARTGWKVEANLHEISGPDPDPNIFDTETIVSDVKLTNASPESVKARSGPSELGVSHHVEEAPEENEFEERQTGKSLVIVHREPTEYVRKVAEDTDSKLRKLNKLEMKYQELLRAYRRAHARNSAIEPFEACLREMTPLTSINDPGAFGEFLNQLNQKNNMISEELKRLVNKNDVADKELNAAKESSTQAWNEVTRLKSVFEGEGSFEAHNSQQIRLESNMSHSSYCTNTLNEESNRKSNEQDTSATEIVHATNDVVTALQDELHQRTIQINLLEEDNTFLQAEVSAAKKTSDNTKQDLEEANLGIQSLKEQLQGKDSELIGMELQVQELDSELSAYRSNIASKDSIVSKQAANLEELHALHSKNFHMGQNKIQNNSMENSSMEITANSRLITDKNNSYPHSSSTVGDTTAVAEDVTGDTRFIPYQIHQGGIDNGSELLRKQESLITELKNKLEEHGDMIEEVEVLRDELIHISQEHVQDKERIKILVEKNVELQQKLSSLQTPLSRTQSQTGTPIGPENDSKGVNAKTNDMFQSVNKLHKGNDAVAESLGESKEVVPKLQLIEAELCAAQQLAASRYEEIVQARDLIQETQSELRSVRTELLELKAFRAEFNFNIEEVRRLKAEKENLKAELSSAKQATSTKDLEIRNIYAKMEQENSRFVNLDESLRKYQRELSKCQDENRESVAAKEKALNDLSRSNKELDQLQERLERSNNDIKELNGQINILHDEISLKAAQHASAQSLMSSIRDQSAEMAVQMKESKDQCESLEEELTDAHRLMSERVRESETMRRLIGDVEIRTDSRIKEIKEKLEIALQERDRAEADAITAGKRRAKESAGLKTKVLDLERDLSMSRESRMKMDREYKTLLDQSRCDADKIEQYAQELLEIRHAMSELRDILDNSERQVQTLELEKTVLKQETEDVHRRLEKTLRTFKGVSEELRALRSGRTQRLESNRLSSCSSIESSRTGKAVSPTPSDREAFQSPGIAQQSMTTAVDLVYLKNVLLQFLERTEKSHQLQLLPVLSMLLHFDKKDEQKWTTIVNSR